MLIPFKNKQIYVECHGEGAPIVILNGIMMSTASWKPFIVTLSKHNKLILLDFLDQGQSSKMDKGYDIAIQADVVKCALDALRIEKAHFIGISYGASVAMNFALMYPQYVDKMVLYNCIPYSSPWILAVGKSWQLARTSPEAYYYTAIPTIYSMDFYNNNQDWLDRRKDFLMKNVFNNPEFLGAMERLSQSSATHDVRERLSEIKAKTLLVGGNADYLTPISEQKYIHERIAGSSLVIMEGCGHAAMYEQPDIFASLLTGFVNSDSVIL
ncbi:MAG: alpha/beta hydrolase [Defluviitaleaceae bacterium]|nr:alpha/beta hydrolase [Defluviitaleaceae bacterium]